MSVTAAVLLVVALDLLVVGALAYVSRLPFRLDRTAAAAPVRRLFDPELEPDLVETRAA